VSRLSRQCGILNISQPGSQVLLRDSFTFYFFYLFLQLQRPCRLAIRGSQIKMLSTICFPRQCYKFRLSLREVRFDITLTQRTDTKVAPIWMLGEHQLCSILYSLAVTGPEWRHTRICVHVTLTLHSRMPLCKYHASWLKRHAFLNLMSGCVLFESRQDTHYPDWRFSRFAPSFEADAEILERYMSAPPALRVGGTTCVYQSDFWIRFRIFKTLFRETLLLLLWRWTNSEDNRKQNAKQVIIV
jgi:hypothetical protein